MRPTAQAVIAHLGLQPHPEGGWFAETFRSELDVGVVLDGRTRAASTAIHFLLDRGTFSAWHEVGSDEVWHHYAGGPLELHLLDASGPRVIRLGPDLLAGDHTHAVVPAGVLQAARPVDDWVLVGCTVAPGFDFADFDMPSRGALKARFPGNDAIIEAFTR